jgi:hypothetical protein
MPKGISDCSETKSQATAFAALTIRHARSIKRGMEQVFSVDEILDDWYSLRDPIDSD